MHFGNLSFSENNDKNSFLVGALTIFSALAMWAWYSINNGEFLSRNPQIPSSLWSSFIGVVCLVGGVVGFGMIFLIAPQTCYLPMASKSELLTYLFAAFINGFFASWMTLFLWNRASRLVPMAVLGQMGVFEVLFGLFYYYLIIGTLPTLYEVAGVALILTGLFFSFRRFLSPEVKQVT
jgi:drug/metabolite transporter (DMT)-like permease